MKKKRTIRDLIEDYDLALRTLADLRPDNSYGPNQEDIVAADRYEKARRALTDLAEFYESFYNSVQPT